MRVTRRVIPGLFIAAMALFVIIRLAPIHLPPLDPEVALIEAPVHDREDRGHRVFGYATLTNPVVRLVVVGRLVPSEPGRLPGMRRDGRDLRDAPGQMLDGRVFSVSGPELARLDRFERLGTRYRRDRAVLADGSVAWVYRLLQ